jgi:CheY-like chemotaxis protein
VTLSGLLIAEENSVSAPARIVLIEDSEPDVCLVREALEQCGLNFDLQVFEDGERGVDFIEAIGKDAAIPVPKLILLDLNLPKKGGLKCWSEYTPQPGMRPSSGGDPDFLGLSQGQDTRS